MDKEVGLMRVDRERPLSEELSGRCFRAVQRILEGQSNRAENLLKEHRKTLDRIVDALMTHERLLKEELLNLLTIDERKLAESEKRDGMGSEVHGSEDKLFTALFVHAKFHEG